MSDDVEKISYKKINAILIRRHDTSILVEIPPRPDRVWVPRSLLSTATDTMVEDLPQMAEFEMRLATWKAEQLGI